MRKAIIAFQYEPNVKATVAFLRLLEVKVNSATVNETLQNHFDWLSQHEQDEKTKK